MRNLRDAAEPELAGSPGLTRGREEVMGLREVNFYAGHS